MKKILFLFLILIVPVTAFGQWGQNDGGVTGLTSDGSTISASLPFTSTSQFSLARATLDSIKFMFGTDFLTFENNNVEFFKLDAAGDLTLTPTANDDGILLKATSGRLVRRIAIGSTINGNAYDIGYQGADVLHWRFDAELNSDSYFNGPGTGTGGVAFHNTSTTARVGIFGRNNAQDMLHVIGDDAATVGDSSVVINAAGDINPGADGSQDLGTQTTAQWANVWADLVNGADFGFDNDWRLLESDKFKGYPKGIAIGNKKRNKFKDGVATGRAKGKPVFVVTEEFIEYKGTRITHKQWRKLAKIASER